MTRRTRRRPRRHQRHHRDRAARLRTGRPAFAARRARRPRRRPPDARARRGPAARRRRRDGLCRGHVARTAAGCSPEAGCGDATPGAGDFAGRASARAARPATRGACSRSRSRWRPRAAASTAALLRRPDAPGAGRSSGPSRRSWTTCARWARSKLLFLDLNLIARHRATRRRCSRRSIPLGVTWGGLATTRIAHDEELLGLAVALRLPRAADRLRVASRGHAGPSRGSGSTRPSRPEANTVGCMDTLHDRGIAIMGCFVFGFDTDMPEVFDRDGRVRPRCEHRPAALRDPDAVPRHAAPPRLKAEGRMLTDDWSLYDAQHVVFQPTQMTPEALLRGTERAWKQTYRWRAIAKRLAGSRTQTALGARDERRLPLLRASAARVLHLRLAAWPRARF